MLVCTTIVESGIDIPNANTLIVERADNSRPVPAAPAARPGRPRPRAGYAYFLYPPEKPLTETAHERLATIAQHTDLGAGMYVAMKDLEIRGAGNLLGGEQSGHIEGVGFDLYVRMVGEAVAEFKARATASGGGAADVKVDLPVDAHLPHDYVAGRAAAPGGVPADRRGRDDADIGGGARRARRPLRQAARAGGEPAGGGPASGCTPAAPDSPTSRCRASTSGSPRWS